MPGMPTVVRVPRELKFTCAPRTPTDKLAPRLPRLIRPNLPSLMLRRNSKPTIHPAYVPPGEPCPENGVRVASRLTPRPRPPHPPPPSRASSRPRAIAPGTRGAWSRRYRSTCRDCGAAPAATATLSSLPGARALPRLRGLWRALRVSMAPKRATTGAGSAAAGGGMSETEGRGAPPFRCAASSRRNAGTSPPLTTAPALPSRRR